MSWHAASLNPGGRVALAAGGSRGIAAASALALRPA